jgi:hypothetical protein
MIYRASKRFIKLHKGVYLYDGYVIAKNYYLKRGKDLGSWYIVEPRYNGYTIIDCSKIINELGKSTRYNGMKIENLKIMYGYLSYGFYRVNRRDEGELNVR